MPLLPFASAAAAPAAAAAAAALVPVWLSPRQLPALRKQGRSSSIGCCQGCCCWRYDEDEEDEEAAGDAEIPNKQKRLEIVRSGSGLEAEVLHA